MSRPEAQLLLTASQIPRCQNKGLGEKARDYRTEEECHGKDHWGGHAV